MVQLVMHHLELVEVWLYEQVSSFTCPSSLLGSHRGVLEAC